MKQRIPFVGPNYQARSVNADAQRTLNCYLEMDNNTPRAPVALYGRPGLEYRGVIGNGPIRAMFREGSVVYVVSGIEVYKLTFPGAYSAVKLGNLSTSTGAVGIASNGSEILFVDGVGGWLVDTTTFVMTAIADVDFPNGVKSAGCLNSYFLVCGDGTQQVYWSQNAGSGAAWDGLDFASAEALPDNLLGLIVDHGEVWLIGDASAEIFTMTSDADALFQRNGSAFIEYGCVSAATLAKLDNSIVWLGMNDQGGARVYRTNGYSPVPISDHALENTMQGYEVTSDARAFSYQQDGHQFYVLSFPTEDATWVYDVASGRWFEWATADVFGTDHIWRAACHVHFGIDHLVGDYVNGSFYRLNLDVYQDNSAAINRLRTTQAMENVQDRMFYSSLQVDMESGVGGTLSMRYSDDGGHTWSGTKTCSMGAAADYDARVIFRRLGSGRNRVWEISTNSNAKFAVIGAVADVTVGSS